MPPQGVFPREHATAVIALVIALLHVHALMVSQEVCLADESLIAAVGCAWKRIFAFLVVSLHVGLEVVAAVEELAASLDFALEVCLFSGGEASWCFARARNSVWPFNVLQKSRGPGPRIVLIRLHVVIFRLWPGGLAI